MRMATLGPDSRNDGLMALGAPLARLNPAAWHLRTVGLPATAPFGLAS